MSSLRPRTLDPDFGGGAPTSGAPTPMGPYRIARDPAVDGSTEEQRRSVGLNGNPDPPVVLGAQTSELDRDIGGPFTGVGRPGAWRTAPFRPEARSLDKNSPQLGGAGAGTLAPGTIRRNVQYMKNGIAAQGFFSWAANAITYALGFEPARPPQDEYVVSSLFLGIADSLATVVSGSSKPAPGLEPFRGGATVQAGASTGWPILAPQIPSFGSRVPLRRPRGLVAVDSS